MGSPERIRSRVECDIEEDIEVNIDIVRDDDGDGYVRSKSRANKSRKPGNIGEADGLDGSGRKRSTSDGHKIRKRVSGSGKAAADQDDYEAKNELCKQVKKKSEENILDKLSTWYQDGEAENKFDGVDRSGIRDRCIRFDDSERKKPTSKYSEHNADVEKGDTDLRILERSSRKRWDETGNIGKADEYVEKSDVRIRNPSDPKLGTTENKSMGLDSINEKGIKSHDREERRVDIESIKRGRSDAAKEDINISSIIDDKSSKERFEEYAQPRNPIQDIVNNSDRPFNADEDVSMWTRDRSRRDIDISSSSRTPEKTGKRQYELDYTDIERSTSFRRKYASFDDRSKGRDDSWGDRNRDQDNLKDNSKRRQDKETRDGESTYDNSRDWDYRRRDRSEGDNRYHGRSIGRKDGNRTEAVKTSSKYGISNENYDVIEIQTKPFDYVREDFRTAVVKNNEAIQQSNTKPGPEVEEFAYSREDRSNAKDSFMDDGPSMQDQQSWRNDNDSQTENPKGVEGNHGVTGQSSFSGPLPPFGNQEGGSGSYSRTASQGVKGNRMGRGGRGRPIGRDGQQPVIPMPIVGSHFGHIGLPPPGPIPFLTPNMSPAPDSTISPGVFIPPFQPPIVWPGARGVEMNMLAIPPGLPPVPPPGPRFPPSLGNQPNCSVFSSSGPGRGMPPNISGPNFNANFPVGRGQSQDKFSGGWVPPRTNVPPGKARSRGEQNDYSQNFVDTGMRPQNFIRELELTSVVEDYPKLRELIQRKDEIVAKSASPPIYLKCDLREQVLSPELFGTKFDVILVDPPWEEYVHRAPGVTDHMEHWTFEEIMNLKIEAIADTPSFIFLWVGDGVGLEQGRQCLKKWGFRRCEDICWVKTNKTTATPGLRHDSHTLYQRTKEHCLMGIKGTVRRSTDGHIIHANIDTDVIIAEEPPYGSTAKPDDMYRIIEHFALGRRRLELFGEDHNIRSGWLTIGKELTSSNFNSEAYVRNFADKDGKVWLGGGGRNPPPEAPHLALTTPEIESLRPKSPMKNQQQLQQQSSVAISLTATSSNKRPTGNSPGAVNHEASSSDIPSPAPWGSSPMVHEGGHMPPDGFEMYGYNAPFGPGGGEFFDYGSHRGLNML